MRSERVLPVKGSPSMSTVRQTFIPTANHFEMKIRLGFFVLLFNTLCNGLLCFKAAVLVQGIMKCCSAATTLTHCAIVALDLHAQFERSGVESVCLSLLEVTSCLVRCAGRLCFSNAESRPQYQRGPAGGCRSCSGSDAGCWMYGSDFSHR